MCVNMGKEPLIFYQGEQINFKYIEKPYVSTQQSHYWAYILRRPKLKRTHVPQYSLQHFLQWLGHGSNRDVHRQMSGYRNCGTYTKMECYSVIKMNKIVSLLERWMDLERDIQRRKSEREKQRLNINVYVWDREEWHRWPYLQSRNQDSDIETKCMVPRGKGLGWEELEYWDWHIHTTDTMCKIDTCWEYTV